MTTNVGLRAFARPPLPDPARLRQLDRRDIAHLADAMHGFGVVDPAIRPVFTPVRRAIGPAFATARLNDHHAFLDLPPGAPVALGDLIGFGISHPCLAFDRWRLIPVVDETWHLSGAVHTFF